MRLVEISPDKSALSMRLGKLRKLTAGLAALCISSSATADLLFQEDFSGGILHSNEVFSWSQSNSVVVSEHQDRFGVTRPLMDFTYAAYGTGGSSDDEKWIEKRWQLTQGYAEFVIGFWLRVPDNFEQNNVDGGNSNNKLFMLWMDGYSTKGDGSTVGMEYRGSSTGSYFYGKVSNGRGSVLGGDQGAAPFISIPNDRGRWMHLVARIVPESYPDARDGTFEVWRRWHGDSEFEKTHELLDQPIRIPDSGPFGIAHGYLLGYANSAFSEDTTFLIDDFRIGTTLGSIGVDVQETLVRPVAPYNLSAQ